MPKFDHFDFLAPLYEKAIPPNISDTLLELLDLRSGQRILDAAGGTGRVSSLIANRAGGIFLGDLSIRMLQSAGKKPDLFRFCAMAEEMPFQTGSFDRIFMVDAFHHLRHQERAISEMWRILRPSGKLIIEEPDIHRLSVKLIAIIEKAALMRSHFLNVEEIQKLLNLYQPIEVRVEAKDHTVWVCATKSLE